MLQVIPMAPGLPTAPDGATFAHIEGTGELAVLVASIAAAAWVYTRGVATLWNQAGRGRGISMGRVGGFLVGLVVILMALVGPIPAAAERLFSAHMVQHQLLMLGAAPLLILGRPGMALVWALPRSHRRPVTRWRYRLGVNVLMARPVALVLMMGSLWAWHVPTAYEAAVRIPLLHSVEHITLFGTAVLFWASLGVRHNRRLGGSILSLFLAGMGTSILAALLLFAGSPLYPEYAAEASRMAVSAIEDQRTAALIMWIPSGLVGIAAMVVLFTRWLGAIDGEPETRLIEASATMGVAP